MAKNRGLGKGLEALFAENSEDNSKVLTLSLSEIEPNRNQPRKVFDEKALAELAQSIAAHGVIQPLLVRPLTSGRYQLVAGERRFRASHLAGLTEVPVVVREMNEREASELALIENLQREDLNPIEESIGFEKLMEDYSLTQEEVAKAVGKSRSAVANALRLLSLPKEVSALVSGGELSAGHARTILSFENKKRQLEVAREIVEKGLSVREVERLSKQEKDDILNKNGKVDKTSVVKKPAARESFFDEVELALTEHLGRKVKVSGGESQKGGILQFEFYSKDDLRMLVNDIFPEDD